MLVSTNRPIFNEIRSTTTLGLLWNPKILKCFKSRITPHKRNNKLDGEYKTKDAGHYCINI